MREEVKVLARVLDAIECTEELPGQMPDSHWEMIQGLNREQMTEYLRGLIRDTKREIRVKIAGNLS